MNNTAEIKTDGLNLYITLISKAHPVGKVMLTVLNVLALLAYSVVLLSIDDEDLKRVFVPAVFLFIMIFFSQGAIGFEFFSAKNTLCSTPRPLCIIKILAS